jgi:RND superfamily putative drug exporter
MGRWNWWAPGPMGRLADKLGFSHVEDEPDDPDQPVDGDGGEVGRRAAGLAGS